MFVFSNFLSGIAHVLDIGLNIYMWVIIIRALISWVNPDPYNPIVQFLVNVTEPVLYRIRRFLPSMGLDLSPVVAILAIVFLRSFLVRTLFQLAQRLY
ncbi:MAG: YggT family protein [Deltaproteobacteria bacterium]|nr:YggT family protein [Deltaproteobacteria bacterium]MBW2308604.1 YggT family protein [Deltaproteobacteria bacterium]